jgi:hypothetical protein
MEHAMQTRDRTSVALMASINALATFAAIEVNSLVSELAQSVFSAIVDGSTGLFTLGALDLMWRPVSAGSVQTSL